MIVIVFVSKFLNSKANREGNKDNKNIENWYVRTGYSVGVASEFGLGLWTIGFVSAHVNILYEINDLVVCQL